MFSSPISQTLSIKYFLFFKMLWIWNQKLAAYQIFTSGTLLLTYFTLLLPSWRWTEGRLRTVTLLQIKIFQNYRREYTFKTVPCCYDIWSSEDTLLYFMHKNSIKSSNKIFCKSSESGEMIFYINNKNVQKWLYIVMTIIVFF